MASVSDIAPLSATANTGTGDDGIQAEITKLADTIIKSSTDIFVLLNIILAISSIAFLKPLGALVPLSGPLRLLVPVVGTSNSVSSGDISATDAI